MAKIISIIIFVLLVLTAGSYEPVASVEPIFTIGRTYDKNEIHYFLKTDKNGKLTSEPLELKWANYEQKRGAYEEVNWIKKQYGYRPVFELVKPEKAVFHIVSFESKKFEIKKTTQGRYATFITFDNRELEVNRIFIYMDGGSFWAPNILYAEVYGTDVKSGKAIKETVKP